MTIREFAKLCDVSPATASRFFSGHGSISEPVRLRIEEIAKRTGYIPPESFRGRRKTSSLIIVIVPKFRQHLFYDMLEQLRICADKKEKQLLILPVGCQNPQDTLAFITSCDPMGVILFREGVPLPLTNALSHLNFPVVVCGESVSGHRFSTVHIDDLMAAYDGTNYLLGLGHRQIGFLTDASRAIGSSFQRLAGCRKAMEDAHCIWEESCVELGNLSFDAGYVGAERLLERKPNLTAVFAFSDDAATGAITKLRESGKRVPDDISVLGFGDSSIARQFYPPLTTVHQPLDQIAQKILDRLSDIQGAHDTSTLTLTCDIAERTSCSAVSSYQKCRKAPAFRHRDIRHT